MFLNHFNIKIKFKKIKKYFVNIFLNKNILKHKK